MALGIPSNGLVRAQTGNFSIALMVVSGFLFISVLIAVLMRVAPKPIVPVADHGARA